MDDLVGKAFSKCLRRDRYGVSDGVDVKQLYVLGDGKRVEHERVVGELDEWSYGTAIQSFSPLFALDGTQGGAHLWACRHQSAP
jgi:hypothetical protein